LTYWIGLIVMGPTTIFLMGEGKLINISPIWGPIIFWVIVLTGIVSSYAVMRKKHFGNWYKNVFLYGAY